MNVTFRNSTQEIYFQMSLSSHFTMLEYIPFDKTFCKEIDSQVECYPRTEQGYFTNLSFNGLHQLDFGSDIKMLAKNADVEVQGVQITYNESIPQGFLFVQNVSCVTFNSSCPIYANVDLGPVRFLNSFVDQYPGQSFKL